MDAVLGLSVTPSAVGLVLVEGQDADGATIDGLGFDVDDRGSASALRTCEQAVAALLRAEANAADQGHRVRSIGVTWSDDADAEASLLLKSLSNSGFDNIVPVRLSEATDALARGIAEVTGYPTTAVCVIEPEQLIALVVQTEQGAVQTAVNHTVVTEEDLVGWLSAVFTKADWAPEALVLVGSAEDLDGLRPVLEDALSVPVYTPAEAQLALARGAALACAQNGELRLDREDGDVRAVIPGRRARGLVQTGPAAVLAAGLVTFVASASAALALQAAPERTATTPRPTDATAQTPVAVRGPAPAPPLPAAPVVDVAQLPAPEAPAVPVPQAEPEAAPMPEAPPIPDAAPPPPEGTVAPLPLDAPLPPAGLAPPPPAPEMIPPPVPEERPGILQRIRERLAGGGADQQQPAVVPPPPAVPPPLP